jgi:hypothetical protein
VLNNKQNKHEELNEVINNLANENFDENGNLIYLSLRILRYEEIGNEASQVLSDPYTIPPILY